jgi:SAM-dependent methyltransferase
MGNPLQNREFLREQYATQDNLQTRIETHQRYSENPADLPVWVLDQIEWRGNETVLDVGCGSGAYAAPVLARAGRYIAGDYSPGMVGGLPPAVTRRVVLDAQRLPLAAATADVILANHMLYHVPDIGAAVAQFARVLKPGGTLLAATNSNSNYVELYDMVDRVLAALGRPDRPVSRPHHDFRLENGAQWFEPHFESVVRHDLPGALVFTEPEPVMRYLFSMLEHMAPGVAALPLAEVARALEKELQAVIDAHGAFRTRKVACVFVCR